MYFANGEMLAFESSLDVYEMVETLGKKNPNYFFAAIDDKQLLMVNLKDNNNNPYILFTKNVVEEKECRRAINSPAYSWRLLTRSP